MCKNNFRKLGYHPLEGKELFLSNKLYSKSSAMLIQQTIYIFSILRMKILEHVN